MQTEQALYLASQEYSERQRKEAAFYNSRGKDNPECPICRDKGFIYTSANSGYACECRKKKTIQRAVTRSGLTKKLEQCTFDSFIILHEWQRLIKEMALRYLGEQGYWLYIGGQVGGGKTHLCTAIVKALLERGQEARYLVWPDEVNGLKGNADGYNERLDELKRMPVLYIDDFLKCSMGGKPTPGEINVAISLIFYRYNNPELITIFSSEHFVDEVAGFDAGLGSRIYERCGPYRLEVGRDPSRNVRMWQK